MPDDSRINIAFLIDTIACDTAGTQKQLLQLIKRLDRKRFKPFLVCLWQSDWMEQNALPCEHFVLGYKGFLKRNFPGVVRKLVATIRYKNVHIVQTFFEDSIFVGFFAKVISRTSFILLSSRRDMGIGKENRPWYHSLYGVMLPWVNYVFDGIIANSEQVRQYVVNRERTSVKKIKVIHNGVEIPKRSFQRPGIFKAGDSESVWIGVVASLTSVKRHDLLVRAVAVLRNMGRFEGVHVVVLGEGPEAGCLKQLIADLKVVEYFHFVGAVKNVEDYLYNIDVGVLCSDREGLSNAILEYMSCGLPVVATAVGGNAELIDKENGICFPPGDYHALADALRHLIKDEKLRKELGAGALRKIRQSFSWEKSMAAHEEYYTTMLGRMR